MASKAPTRRKSSSKAQHHPQEEGIGRHLIILKQMTKKKKSNALSVLMIYADKANIGYYVLQLKVQ